MKKYDTGIFIGRFRPFHNGHKHLLQNALSKSTKVIIIVGSAHKATDSRNMFTLEEVEEMIRQSLTEDENQRITIIGVRDRGNNTKWCTEIRHKVSELTSDTNIGIFGHDKDKTSQYLYDFPDWELEIQDKFEDIDATTIRKKLIEGQIETNCIPSGTIEFLEGWIKSPSYKRIIDEHIFMENYNNGFVSPSTKKYNIKPKHYTCDSVVIHAGHILLIQRISFPGRDLWALPGGHVEDDETAEFASLRELYEETRISLSKKELKKSLLYSKVYDDPNRSMRKRTITNAFLYYLESNKTGTSQAQIKKDFSHPKIRGHSDAKQAKWFPISLVLSDEFSSQLFEDHAIIIEQMNDWLNAQGK